MRVQMAPAQGPDTRLEILRRLVTPGMLESHSAGTVRSCKKATSRPRCVVSGAQHGAGGRGQPREASCKSLSLLRGSADTVAK